MPKKNKNNIIYFCSECGYESVKWLGQCPICKSWDTFVEHKIDNELNVNQNTKTETIKPLSIDEIDNSNEVRLKTTMNEFDNLLGGGIVKGSFILLGGSPGIGKSTLVLQISKLISNNGYKVLYVSGEENLSQIKLRANRIGQFNNNVLFISSTDINQIIDVVNNIKPDLLIVDSIQTMSDSSSNNVAGSIVEIKNCAMLLFKLAKSSNVSIIVVGHITKDGQVAGPKILEHMVDTVLYFEDDQIRQYNLLRCYKNRFGSNKELAIFEMTNNGLKEVSNPSMIFLEGKNEIASGCAITCSIDCNKPIFLEVQSLVSKSSFSIPRRTINGSDYNRLNILIAIIEKRMKIDLSFFDIYVNITGGIKVKDTSIDLAIIMAILSSYRNIAISSECIYCGEVGLSGEIRNIIGVETRIKEAIRLGYKKIFLPKVSVDNLKNDIYKNQIEIIGMENVSK